MKYTATAAGLHNRRRGKSASTTALRQKCEATVWQWRGKNEAKARQRRGNFRLTTEQWQMTTPPKSPRYVTRIDLADAARPVAHTNGTKRFSGLEFASELTPQPSIYGIYITHVCSHTVDVCMFICVYMVYPWRYIDIYAYAHMYVYVLVILPLLVAPFGQNLVNMSPVALLNLSIRLATLDFDQTPLQITKC